jgi:hypothetical protein
MFCPQCGVEYEERMAECPDCHVPLTDSRPEPGASAETPADEGDLEVLIRTGFQNPVAISLARSLLQQAGIPFFSMDQNQAARQESGNILGWWDVRVSRDRETEAREILQSVEEMK